MGSGFGHYQQSILDLLRESSQQMTFEKLRWTLWEHESGSSAPDLPTKRDTSIKRAINSLEKKGHLRINERPLVSVEECIEHFPHKTLSADVRDLREQLLSVVFAWPEATTRYTLAENEQFQLESASKDEREKLHAMWMQVEPKLVALLPACASPTRNHLFSLIAKGKSLFETSEFRSRMSFEALASKFIETDTCPLDLGQEIWNLKELLLDIDDQGFLRLKSIIRSIAYVPEKGSEWNLKPQTIEYLESSSPSVLSNLHGYQPAPVPPKQGKYRLVHAVRRPVQSPLLNKLFDHSVYTKFRFIEIG